MAVQLVFHRLHRLLRYEFSLRGALQARGRPARSQRQLRVASRAARGGALQGQADEHRGSAGTVHCRDARGRRRPPRGIGAKSGPALRRTRKRRGRTRKQQYPDCDARSGAHGSWRGDGHGLRRRRLPAARRSALPHAVATGAGRPGRRAWRCGGSGCCSECGRGRSRCRRRLVRHRGGAAALPVGCHFSSLAGCPRRRHRRRLGWCWVGGRGGRPRAGAGCRRRLGPGAVGLRAGPAVGGRLCVGRLRLCLAPQH
mmetsp:Transcript_30567/g.101697  ORF Transcript_30567/g.101697 Transcript_30567/m.101697 type:complete len:256 (+) Transcript_30567:102-869(+)